MLESSQEGEEREKTLNLKGRFGEGAKFMCVEVNRHNYNQNNTSGEN